MEPNQKILVLPFFESNKEKVKSCFAFVLVQFSSTIYKIGQSSQIGSS